MTGTTLTRTADGSIFEFEFVPHTSRVTVHKDGYFQGSGWRYMAETVEEFAARWIYERKWDYVPFADRPVQP